MNESILFFISDGIGRARDPRSPMATGRNPLLQGAHCLPRQGTHAHAPQEGIIFTTRNDSIYYFESIDILPYPLIQ